LNSRFEQKRDQPAASGERPRPLAFLTGDDFDRDLWSVFGAPVDAARLPDATEAISVACRTGRRLSFITPNVNWMARAVRSSDARREIIASDYSLVDGAPVVLLARLSGAPIRERCAGADLFDALRLRPGFQGRRIKVFFFGGREGAGERAAERINKEGRGVECVGHLNPGHGDVASMSSLEIIDSVNRSGADFVLVSLGAAKGQTWIDRNRSQLKAPVVAHLGAVVDFVAGGVRRAPKWVRASGLEWVWRIKEDPSLWRRYRDDAAALARLLVARGPAILNEARRRAVVPERIDAHAEPAATRLVVAGDLVGSLSADSRNALRAAARAGKPVIVDLAEAGALGPSFFGLLMALEKHLAAAGADMTLANASPSRRRLFVAHGLSYADAPQAREACKAGAAAIAGAA
jgi:N-acetylglucosaminyldiphosphoundecaprenol N-acetyl-beta-D-mannosaminyltransferase